MASELEVGKAKLGTIAMQGDALLGARANGDSINFGHANQSGYGSNLGCGNNNGHPYLAFMCEHGTNNNTFRTRGEHGNVIQATATGELKFSQVTNANADNQTATDRLTIASNGDATFTGTTVVPRLGVESDHASFKLYNNSNTYLNGTTTLNGLVTCNNGIAFQSATTGSGTGTGYTLDSYETGTFTPTISAENGTINGTEQFGRYTRVGNMVHVSFSIKCTGVSGASGAVGFAGMPFTSANVDSSFNTALTVRYNALGSAVESVICRLFSNSAGGRIEEQTGTYTSNLADNVQNNTVFQVSGSYLV